MYEPVILYRSISKKSYYSIQDKTLNLSFKCIT
jgi:hypothetical protein